MCQDKNEEHKNKYVTNAHRSYASKAFWSFEPALGPQRQQRGKNKKATVGLVVQVKRVHGSRQVWKVDLPKKKDLIEIGRHLGNAFILSTFLKIVEQKETLLFGLLIKFVTLSHESKFLHGTNTQPSRVGFTSGQAVNPGYARVDVMRFRDNS